MKHYIVVLTIVLLLLNLGMIIIDRIQTALKTQFLNSDLYIIIIKNKILNNCMRNMLIYYLTFYLDRNI